MISPTGKIISSELHWLKRQINVARMDVFNWPEWKKAAIIIGKANA